jgi:hypothetical protein
MKNGFRILSLIVFLIGILSFSLAWGKRKSDVEPSRSYVVISYEAQTSPDGKKTITAWRKKYVKADGEWKIVQYGSDAAAAFADDPTSSVKTSRPVFAGTTEGVFAKASDSDERKSMSTSALESVEMKYHSHHFLKNHSQFVRMDEVAGLEVYVMRVVSEENPNYWVECSVSPLTGRSPLRIVSHNLDGTEYITEAVKVEFREVPDNLNEDIKALPNTGKLDDKTTSPKQ